MEWWAKYEFYYEFKAYQTRTGKDGKTVYKLITTGTLPKMPLYSAKEIAIELSFIFPDVDHIALKVWLLNGDEDARPVDIFVRLRNNPLWQ